MIRYDHGFFFLLACFFWLYRQASERVGHYRIFSSFSSFITLHCDGLDLWLLLSNGMYGAGHDTLYPRTGGLHWWNLLSVHFAISILEGFFLFISIARQLHLRTLNLLCHGKRRERYTTTDVGPTLASNTYVILFSLNMAFNTIFRLFRLFCIMLYLPPFRRRDVGKWVLVVCHPQTKAFVHETRIFIFPHANFTKFQRKK